MLGNVITSYWTACDKETIQEKETEMNKMRAPLFLCSDLCVYLCFRILCTSKCKLFQWPTWFGYFIFRTLVFQRWRKLSIFILHTHTLRYMPRNRSKPAISEYLLEVEFNRSLSVVMILNWIFLKVVNVHNKYLLLFNPCIHVHEWVYEWIIVNK